MADGTAVGAVRSGLLDVGAAGAGRLVEHARSAAAGEQAGIPDTAKEDAKIDKSSKDFESILLSSWLEGAEKSFATVPGGDGEDDDDTSKDQFQGIAMQALGSSLTASGGIGIAKMIAQHLHAAVQRQSAHETEKNPATGEGKG